MAKPLGHINSPSEALLAHAATFRRIQPKLWWTADDEADLLAWTAEGVALPIIAQRLGRTWSAVYGKRRDLKRVVKT